MPFSSRRVSSPDHRRASCVETGLPQDRNDAGPERLPCRNHAGGARALGLTFVAARSDGLGERLRALLNAMALAQATGAGFAFNWRSIRPRDIPFHDTLPVNETFSRDFVNRFHIANGPLKRLAPASLNIADAAIAAAWDTDGALGDVVLDDGPVHHVLVGQNDLSRQAPALARTVALPPDMRALFDAIPFSPAMDAARRAAARVALPDDVTAIHLRAGDIIYGHHRFSGRYHGKVCPYPIAMGIARDLRAKGRTPLIFCQDQAVGPLFKAEAGAILAHEIDVGTEFSRAQQALFEISLMSRCTEIIAASSGFALAAALVKGRTARNPRKAYPAETAVHLIEDAVFTEPPWAGVSDLQRAFACWSAFDLAGHLVPPDDRFRRLLDLGRRLDPENGFLDLVHACDLYLQDAPARAEALLTGLLSTGWGDPSPIEQVLTKPFPDKTRTADAYRPILEDQARKGQPVAALCVALICAASSESDKAREYAALFAAHATPDLAALGERLIVPV
jgi:hypothetical protein